MAASPLGRLPAPRVPLLDERTGVMSREWYRFFLSQFQQVEIDSELVIQDFTIDPPAYANALLSAGEPSTSEVLGLAPPGLPIAPRYYGSFYDTTTQTAAAINTAYAVTFNTTRDAFGVRLDHVADHVRQPRRVPDPVPDASRAGKRRNRFSDRVGAAQWRVGARLCYHRASPQ